MIGKWICNNCCALISAARIGLGLIWLPNVLIVLDIVAGSLVTLLDQVLLPLTLTIWVIFPQRKQTGQGISICGLHIRHV